MFRKLRPSIYFEKKRVWVETQDLGLKSNQLCDYVAAPVTNQPVTPKALTAGQNRPHPPHIPSHFPEFPDPHTYIKTPVSVEDIMGAITEAKYSISTDCWVKSLLIKGGLQNSVFLISLFLLINNLAKKNYVLQLANKNIVNKKLKPILPKR